ncbi:hypothetical protein CF392_00280 [Tamilnaduibacter salinus]|uniref:Uncharacterized protein n=1 Tax=Tamilnaduibacter salinus TaxID=1484056 RepID=A0A2A2I885_9GAMM|nr:hypothetical protein [Tamilnaduibacter salinus]PAV27536.1 hypothetical protein CF392_00280 [Tamilnaduibacter salinus]
MLERIYYRDEAGLIRSRDGMGWTIGSYLELHPHLAHAETETLTGWPDPVVSWYAIGGPDCGTSRAVGFPVTERWRLVEHGMMLRQQAAPGTSRGWWTSTRTRWISCGCGWMPLWTASTSNTTSEINSRTRSEAHWR